jgi:hypothetical protein
VGQLSQKWDKAFWGMERRLLRLLVSSKIPLLFVADYLNMGDEKGEGWGKGIERNPLN